MRMKNKKSKRYSVSVFISGLLCILFLTTACKYQNNVKEFIEMEIAGGKSDDLVFYDIHGIDIHDVGANGKTYVPSQKPITGTIPIENEYNLELSAQISYDKNKEILFEARSTVDTAASTPTEIKFTFQFKQDADASTQHPVGQEVPVTVTLIKKLNGTVFATKKFTIRCNTPPEAPTIAYANDIFTITRSGDAIHQDTVSADCIIVAGSFTGKKTVAFAPDGTARVTVKDIALENHIDKLKNANGTRTIQVTTIDKAGLRSTDTRPENGGHTYSTKVDFGCEFNDGVSKTLTFDPPNFAASVETYAGAPKLTVTTLGDGASFIYKNTSYNTTGIKFPIEFPGNTTQQILTFTVIAEDGDTSRDYTVTVKKMTGVEISATDEKPWKKLKDTVADAAKPNVITINGAITATTDAENNGEIVIDRNITIIGKAGAGADTLDAAQLSRIFKVQAGKTLTIQNLTLTGGKTTGNENGGGIYAKTTSDVTNVIKGGSKIQNNSAALGGGIYIEAAPGVHCTVSAETSDITENNGSTGAGVYIAENGEFSINGGSVAKNTGSGPGKGVYVTGESSGLQYTQGGSFSIKNAAIIGSWDNNGKLTDDNDVYLGMNSMAAMLTRITTENLSAAKVARITPESYTVGTQVLDGDISANYQKFIVTPNGSEKWKIAADGTLQKESGGTATTTVSSWTELKAAVENPSGAASLTINGTLTATVASDTIKVTRAVTIQGTDKATCILDANTKCRIFTIDSTGTNGDLTLKNLTLQNGIASGTGQGGGAIYCNASKLTAENIIIKSCRSASTEINF